MKKILFIFAFILFFLTSSVQAKTIKVISMSDFSTKNPLPTYEVKTLQLECFKDGTIIEEGTVISGQVVKVQSAQRGKRDGYFEFVPSSITYNGETKIIRNPISVARVIGYEPIEPQELVVSVAKKAAGFAVKGATQGISFVEGLVQAEDGERLKSGFMKVYKDSPLAYIEVGDELNVKAGDVLVLKFKKLK